jgi:hypothetical protein
MINIFSMAWNANKRSQFICKGYVVLNIVFDHLHIQKSRTFRILDPNHGTKHYTSFQNQLVGHKSAASNPSVEKPTGGLQQSQRKG